MELTIVVKSLLIETAEDLKGSAQCLFVPKEVKALGKGEQQKVQRELRLESF